LEILFFVVLENKKITFDLFLKILSIHFWRKFQKW